MNEQNLRPGANATTFRGRDAADRARAREAGAKGNEAKRQKKLLRESIMEAADMVAALSDAEKQALIEQGCNPDEVTNRVRFVAALWAMAGVASKDGNADRRLLMDASGEMAQNVNVSLGNEKTPQDWAREALEALGDE